MSQGGGRVPPFFETYCIHKKNIIPFRESNLHLVPWVQSMAGQKDPLIPHCRKIMFKSS